MSNYQFEKVRFGLESCVGPGRVDFMAYGDFGRRFRLGEFALAWANRQVLDPVADYFLKDEKFGNLDLTVLLYNKKTKLPSIINGHRFDIKSAKDRNTVARIADSIIERYQSNIRNPYVSRV